MPFQIYLMVEELIYFLILLVKKLPAHIIIKGAKIAIYVSFIPIGTTKMAAKKDAF